MLVWVLLGVAVLLALGAVALIFMLRRARGRARRSEAVLEHAQSSIRALVEQEAIAQAEELRRTLQRTRADSISLLVEEERRIAEERRQAVAEREREAGQTLADTLADAEGRIDERLRGWQDDLERAQRHLEAQLTRLAQHQEHAIAEAETRIEAEARELISTADEQRAAVVRLREELDQAARAAVAEASDELQAHTLERRRTIEEIGERLQKREQNLLEQIERAETDVRARVELAFADVERRQVEQLERLVARETARYAEAAALQFETAVKAAREDAASRLARELDRSIETFVRQADALFAERINHAADQGAMQLERRLRSAQANFERQRDEFAATLQRRLEETDSDLRRTLGALAAEAESERAVLESRLQELARRIDEAIAQVSVRGR